MIYTMRFLTRHVLDINYGKLQDLRLLHFGIPKFLCRTRETG